MEVQQKVSKLPLKGREQSQFKKGPDLRRSKQSKKRWTNESSNSWKVKRMSKDAYDGVIVHDKTSNILLCGVVDKKIPVAMLLRPSGAVKTPIEEARKLSINGERRDNELGTYRIVHFGKKADMFYNNYAGHRSWDSTCERKLEFDLEFDKQMGFGWREKLKCLMCGFKGIPYNLYEEVQTGKRGSKAADINLSVAAGLLDTKIGPNDLRYLMICLKVPPPSYTSMQKHCNFAAEKASEVAAASFNRARQQVIANNEACGFAKYSPILGGVDSQYNNCMRSAGETTPMQPATQVSTSIIEMQTKHKKVIGMHIGSKLSSHTDHSGCDKNSGCSKNLQDTDVIGDEYREAKICMEEILKSNTPITIDNMTTDGDSHAYKGARDAQFEISGKPMERMADVVQLTKTMKNKIKRTEFSASMFPARTKKERTYIQTRVAKDVAHRVMVEFQNLQQKFGSTHMMLLFEKCSALKLAINR